MKDPYLKHVRPEDAARKKDGLNICVFSDYNIAGNLTLIAKLINRYTIHKARCIIVSGDYLGYDSDIVLLKNGDPKPKNTTEAAEIVAKADFFHIGRRPINFPGVDFAKVLKPDNCIIQYFGSYLRDNREAIGRMHRETGIHGVTWVDWTMQEGAGFMHYHLPDMFDVESVTPWYEQYRFKNFTADPTVIVHSPTNRAFKQTDFFLGVVRNLEKKYPIELRLLEGLSNEECLKQKSGGHILFDQISVGRFALSAIESMAMGQVVLCSVSNIVQSVFPDHPVISVTKKTLEVQLRKLLEDPWQIPKIGRAGREWVRKHCDPVRAIRQWVYLYDLAINGNRIVENDDFFINMENEKHD